MDFKNKRVLITGGFGFIGSHLVKRLLDYKANIYIITVPSTNKFRLKDKLSEIIFFEADIRDDFEMNNIIKTINPDYVFHLASYGVNSANNNIYDAVCTNVLGSVNIINALGGDCKKIINIGSCAEYGNEIAIEHNALSPVNIYGSTKAAATLILHQIAAEKDINIVTLRPFGVFGEGEEPHKIFSHVIINLLNDKDVPLTRCEQYRDYCYVENIVDAMLMACADDSIKNEIFNVAAGEIYPLWHYINLIFEAVKTDRKPLYGSVGYRSKELWRPEADITKIKTKLNWMPKISLEEGIKRTVEWYRGNLMEFSS